MSRMVAHLLSALLCVAALASPAWADSDGVGGFYLRSDAAVRLHPIGARVITDGGYRVGLFDSTSRLFVDTFLEAGMSTNLSPVSLWAGPYVEVLPVQVLKLRASAQGMFYFGSFGYVEEVSRNAQGDYEIPVLDDGGSITEGDASLGVLLRVGATPRIKFGSLVVKAETNIGYISMAEADGTYYEPMLDVVFEPKDTFWETKPTGGAIVDLGEGIGTLFYGVRLEHTASFEADFEHDVLLAVLRWSVPRPFYAWGHPKVTVGAGGWLKHAERRGTPYVAVEVGIDWGDVVGD